MTPKLRVSPMPSSPLSAYRAKKMLLELAEWYGKKTLFKLRYTKIDDDCSVEYLTSFLLRKIASHLDLSKRQRRKKNE